MRTVIVVVAGATIVVVAQHTWRYVLVWALSRGDT